MSKRNAASPISPNENCDVGPADTMRSTELGIDGAEESQADAAAGEGEKDGNEVKEDEVAVHDGSEEDIEDSQDVQAPKVAHDPGQPTERQRALHDLLHMLFRTWWQDCLQGQGKDRYHLRIQDESGVPRISIDYMLLKGFQIQEYLGLPSRTKKYAAHRVGR